jgi:tetratricopeptide (TPR) repeat protein
VALLLLVLVVQSFRTIGALDQVSTVLSLDTTPLEFQSRQLSAENRATEGGLLVVSGHYVEAMEAYKVALTLDPSSETARTGLEEAAVLQLLNSPDRLTTDPTKLHYYVLRLQAKPAKFVDPTSATIARGNLAFFVDGDPIEAERLYKEVLLVESTNLGARIGLTALLLARADGPVEALLEDLVGLATSGKPNRFQCETIAKVALLNGEFTSVLTWAEKAAALERTFGAVALMGQARLQLARPDEATAEGNELIRREPKNPLGYQILCQAYVKTKNAEMAVSSCSSAFEADQDVRSLVNLARALTMAGRAKEAVDAYREVLRRDDRQMAALLEFGILLARLGDLKNGTAALERVAGLAAQPGAEFPSDLQALRDEARRQLQLIGPVPPDAAVADPKTPATKK